MRGLGGVLRRLAAFVFALGAASALAAPAGAQTAVRVPVADGAGSSLQLSATLHRPPAAGAAPAVAIFHGCGGVGQNVTRMAQRLAANGYAALLVDSFGARGIRDACTRNWPSVADGQERARDVAAAVRWLRAQPFVAPDRVAIMGYSYGGGVALFHALRALPAAGPGPEFRAAIAVYPDCALRDLPGQRFEAPRPLLMAMAELDDWTPVAQCRALLGRVVAGAERVESAIYPGAHHSFDAMGLSVRYLATAGNRSKPGNCCGATYGYNEAAYRRFQQDVLAFLATHLRP